MNSLNNHSKTLIIIINFNGLNLLKKHLQSVVETNYPNFDIVIVDNASSDNSAEYIKRNFPKIKLLGLDKNYGFGKANNFAFEKYQDYDYYALLNNDITVEKDWLKNLIYTASGDTSIGAVGPKILFSKKNENSKYVINSTGIFIDKYFRGIDRGFGIEDKGQFDKVESVPALTGGAVLLKKDAILSIGGFDERMFFYYEDIDLSLRLKDNGWKIMYNGLAEVYHDHEGTSRKLHSSFDMNVKANTNRIKSIQNRLGIICASKEAFRTFLEYIYCKITGTSLKDRVYNNISENLS